MGWTHFLLRLHQEQSSGQLGVSPLSLSQLDFVKMDNPGLKKLKKNAFSLKNKIKISKKE